MSKRYVLMLSVIVMVGILVGMTTLTQQAGFSLSAYGKDELRSPQGSGPRPLRKGTPGVVYGEVAAIELPLPQAGKDTVYSIYTVSSADGKTIEIHGANKTGYSLLNASGRQWDVMRGFAPGITFETVYKSSITTVGRWSGKKEIIGALSNYICVCGYSYRAVPPKLPGDGETISVKVSDWLAGKDTLVLIFATRPETTAFLVVSQKKNALDKKTEQEIRATVTAFNQAAKKKDVQALLKVVHLPWFHDGVMIVRSRVELQALFAKRFAEPDYELERATFRIAKILSGEEAHKRFRPRDRQLLDQVLRKGDWLVEVHVPNSKREDSGFYLLVGRREGKMKVLGVRD